MQGPGATAAGPLQFRVDEAVQARSPALPGRAVLQHYAAKWPDAVALAPSLASVTIVLSAQAAQMHVLDRESGSVLKKTELRDRAHQKLSFAGAVESGFRRSILIRFDPAELWELFLSEDGPAIYEGLVHDFRMGEGLREPPQYPVRRIPLDAPITSMVSEPGRANVIITQISADGGGRVVRFNLDVRRPIGHARTRSPPGNLTLARVREKDFVVLADAADGPEVFQLPGLAPVEWRQFRDDACRVP
jgi:hypothetical protein